MGLPSTGTVYLDCALWSAAVEAQKRDGHRDMGTLSEVPVPPACSVYPTQITACCRPTVPADSASRDTGTPPTPSLECTAGLLPELCALLLGDASEAYVAGFSRAVLQQDSISEVPAARVASRRRSLSKALWSTCRLLWAMPWHAAVVPRDAAAARAKVLRPFRRPLQAIHFDAVGPADAQSML